jgi:hypothetical protein
LVEKDYWIVHCLYGLQQLGLKFALKGRTSLSKGYYLINRFSEDIDILIEPPPDRDVKVGRNQNSRAQAQTRKDFYDWLAGTIRIDGVEKVERDTAVDDERYRSGGIRLFYNTFVPAMAGLKAGVLLELGFDDVAPNTAKDISSWLYEYAADKVPLIDNRAKGVDCYNPAYTFVEKLQTVSTNFAINRQTADRQSSSCDTTTTSIASSNIQMCKSSSAQTPTKSTRRSGSVRATIRTLQRMKHSFWATPIPASFSKLPMSSRQLSTTRTNRR